MSVPRQVWQGVTPWGLARIVLREDESNPGTALVLVERRVADAMDAQTWIPVPAESATPREEIIDFAMRTMERPA